MQIGLLDTVSLEQSEQINKLMVQLDPSAKQRSFRKLDQIARQPDVYWAAVLDDRNKIHGFAMLAVYGCTIENRGIIEDVIVDESLRGQGWGKALTQYLLDIAKGIGINTVSLTSSPHRVAANKLYQSMGFEKRETNCYRLVLQ